MSATSTATAAMDTDVGVFAAVAVDLFVVVIVVIIAGQPADTGAEEASGRAATHTANGHTVCVWELVRCQWGNYADDRLARRRRAAGERGAPPRPEPLPPSWLTLLPWSR